MKFLIITHIYPPAVDGGSKVVFKLGEYFKNQGHQILTLTSNCSSTDDFTHPYQPSSTIHCSPITIHYLPVYTFLHRPLKLFSKVLSKGPVFKLIPFIKFLNSCLKFRPDFIIAGPLPTTTILYANFIKKLTGAKLLINASFHSTDPEFHQPLLINALKSTDFIWTLTDFETNYFHQHFQVPLSKMINVGNGVDRQLLIRNYELRIKKSKNLLFIGSFAKHKGLETLIDAFSILCSQFTDHYSLTLAGQPTLYSSTIDNKIKSLPPDIRSRIKITYNFKSSTLADLLDQSTVLVSPSTQESFGLVLIEAWARGIPVIAANIPASTELITKSNGGLLFEVNNPSDLVAKIISLLNHKNNYGLNGYKYVKSHFTWDKIGESIWQKISSS